MRTVGAWPATRLAMPAASMAVLNHIIAMSTHRLLGVATRFPSVLNYILRVGAVNTVPRLPAELDSRNGHFLIDIITGVASLKFYRPDDWMNRHATYLDGLRPGV